MVKDSEKITHDKEIILSVIKYALLTAIVILVLYAGINIFWLLFPVIIGFILAHTTNAFSRLLYRLVRRKSPMLTEEGKDTKGFKALKLFNFVLLLLIFTFFIIFVAFALIAQVRNLISYITSDISSVAIIETIIAKTKEYSDALGGILPAVAIERLTSELTNLQDYIINLLPRIATATLNSLVGFVGNLPYLLFRVVVVILSGYYFITDRVAIDKFIDSFLPSKTFVKKTISTITKISNTLFRVFGGYVLILLITFIEALIGLTIIRMPYAVVIALVVTIIDILPAVGASACFFPISIYMFSQGKVFEGFVALAFVGIITSVRSLIEPRIIGSATKLHPLATLVAMILGATAFGLTGFIVGPILLVFIIIILDSFEFKDTLRDWTGKILNKVAKSEESEKSFVRHVVMWKVKPKAAGKSGPENISKMEEKLYSLAGEIPMIRKLEAYKNEIEDKNSYDFVLIVDFDTFEDLQKYKEHPSHVEVAEFIKEVTSDRVVTDYTFTATK